MGSTPDVRTNRGPRRTRGAELGGVPARGRDAELMRWEVRSGGRAVVTGVVAVNRVVLHLSAPKGSQFVRASYFSTICKKKRTGMTIDYTGCKRRTSFVAELPTRRVNRTTVGTLEQCKISASCVTQKKRHVNVCCLRANSTVHPDGIVCSHTRSTVTRTIPRSFSFSTVVRKTS